MFSLGRHSKQPGDTGHLPSAVAFVHPMHLSLAHQVHRFIALERSSCRLEGKEAYPWFDHPFDEPMILPNQVIQVFDKIEPAASHGISHPSDEAGFSQALALALLSSIMYKRTWIETSINEMNSVST